MEHIGQIDLEKASKAELKSALKTTLPQMSALRDSVARLMRQPSAIPLSPTGHPDDSVPTGWAERHGIAIPRAEGVFESQAAWVRIKHGVIVGAGLKNQSILSLMISMELLDDGWASKGDQYKDWRAAFLTSVDPVKWTAGEGRGNPEAWSKEDRYSKLQHRVEQDHFAAMDCIVASRPKAKHLAAYHANQAAFVEAFKIVGRAMRDIDREAEEALEAAKRNKGAILFDCANDKNPIKSQS